MIIRLFKQPWILIKASDALKVAFWRSHDVLEVSVYGDAYFYVHIVIKGDWIHLNRGVGNVSAMVQKLI